jgi:hypothetical protein
LIADPRPWRGRSVTCSCPTSHSTTAARGRRSLLPDRKAATGKTVVTPVPMKEIGVSASYQDGLALNIYTIMLEATDTAAKITATGNKVGITREINANRIVRPPLPTSLLNQEDLRLRNTLWNLFVILACTTEGSKPAAKVKRRIRGAKCNLRKREAREYRSPTSLSRVKATNSQ